MGNVCTSREDTQEDNRTEYEQDVQLRDEVRARLADAKLMEDECRQGFRLSLEKTHSKNGKIPIQLWIEMTRPYIDRLMSNTEWRRDKVYQRVQRSKDMQKEIDETEFFHFTRLLMQLSEQELSERIATWLEKLAKKARTGGGSPARQGNGDAGVVQAPLPIPPTRMPTDKASVPTGLAAGVVQESKDQLLHCLDQEEAAHKRLEALFAQEGLSSFQAQQQQTQVVASMPDLRQALLQTTPAKENGNGSIPKTTNALGLGSTRPRSSSKTPQQELDSVKRDILGGQLKIMVCVGPTKREAKRLSVDPRQQRICLLREEDGRCEDSWPLDSLRSISRGISTILMDVPPPRDVCASFRLQGPASAEDDELFLCVVFDSPGVARLATQAFSELCEVPLQEA
eukprot:TRINITY_DN100459_c0_g1_i1.p1 TRINITY_DN100459_c0_g1~~TRINITY_DN100459_c0_g1_i1.p1  ORF type:complete len:398 (+),score=95.67 TRINITY_DN100459_c0_g1_i1:42-1235(+)